jgi:hypothetical protein
VTSRRMSNLREQNRYLAALFYTKFNELTAKRQSVIAVTAPHIGPP